MADEDLTLDQLKMVLLARARMRIKAAGENKAGLYGADPRPMSDDDKRTIAALPPSKEAARERLPPAYDLFEAQQRREKELTESGTPFDQDPEWLTLAKGLARAQSQETTDNALMFALPLGGKGAKIALQDIAQNTSPLSLMRVGAGRKPLSPDMEMRETVENADKVVQANFGLHTVLHAAHLAMHAAQVANAAGVIRNGGPNTLKMFAESKYLAQRVPRAVGVATGAALDAGQSSVPASPQANYLRMMAQGILPPNTQPPQAAPPSD